MPCLALPSHRSLTSSLFLHAEKTVCRIEGNWGSCAAAGPSVTPAAASDLKKWPALQDLHFKLVSYASTVFPASAHAQQAQHAHGPPLLQPHFMPRRSEDLLWGAMRPAGDHLLPRWPSAQLPPN